MKNWISYDFAVLRAVPHVHVGGFVPVGVVLHARTSEYLGVRAVLDPAQLESLVTVPMSSCWHVTSAPAGQLVRVTPMPVRLRCHPLRSAFTGSPHPGLT